jgi:hypothetical protein
MKELYKEQEREWRCRAMELRQSLALAEARVDYYRQRIAIINHGPRVLVLEAAE